MILLYFLFANFLLCRIQAQDVTLTYPVVDNPFMTQNAISGSVVTVKSDITTVEVFCNPPPGRGRQGGCKFFPWTVAFGPSTVASSSNIPDKPTSGITPSSGGTTTCAIGGAWPSDASAVQGSCSWISTQEFLDGTIVGTNTLESFYDLSSGAVNYVPLTITAGAEKLQGVAPSANVPVPSSGTTTAVGGGAANTTATARPNAPVSSSGPSKTIAPTSSPSSTSSTSSPPLESEDSGSSSGLSTGAKAGIGVAVAVIVALGIIAAVLVMLRRRKRQGLELLDENYPAHMAQPIRVIPTSELLEKRQTPVAELEAGGISVFRAEKSEVDRARSIYELEGSAVIPNRFLARKG